MQWMQSRARQAVRPALLFFFLAGAGWFSLCISEEVHVPAELVYHPNLTYHEAGQASLQLDLVAPRQGGPFPAVVVIPGIGPLAKDRIHYVPRAVAYARQGYAGIVISYSNRSEVPYPRAIEDGKAAIRWLRTHAAKYNIDPNNIAVVGYSGGGALACLLGMQRFENQTASPDLAALPSSQVQAVIAYFPPSDFTRLHADCTSGKIPMPQRWLITDGFETWLGGTPAKVPQRYREASPISHIHADMAPLLLIHGTGDTVIPIEHSQVFAQKITEKKGRLTFLTIPDAIHNFDDDGTIHTDIALAAEADFLAKSLRRVKPARPNGS